MVIHWITGEVNEGKSTRLLKVYRSLQKGDGFYNRKVYQGGIVVGQEIVHLATGESRLLSLKEGFIPANWLEECRFDVYSFSKEGLDFGRTILAEACHRHIAPIFVDEIGPLELQGKGFYSIFAELLRQPAEMYVVVRSSCLKRVINKFVGAYLRDIKSMKEL